MPTFDFRCRRCGTTFEAEIARGSQVRPPCARCRSHSTEKLLTMPLGIHFKGHGFYKTDSRIKEVEGTEVKEKTHRHRSEQVSRKEKTEKGGGSANKATGNVV